MDESHSPYRLNAPGAAPSSRSYRLPAATSPPAVDDHVVEPESDRREVMIEGRILQALPANASHGMQNANLDYATLDRWLERSLVAASQADVFA